MCGPVAQDRLPGAPTDEYLGRVSVDLNWEGKPLRPRIAQAMVSNDDGQDRPARGV